MTKPGSYIPVGSCCCFLQAGNVWQFLPLCLFLPAQFLQNRHFWNFGFFQTFRKLHVKLLMVQVIFLGSWACFVIFITFYGKKKNNFWRFLQFLIFLIDFNRSHSFLYRKWCGLCIVIKFIKSVVLSSKETAYPENMEKFCLFNDSLLDVEMSMCFLQDSNETTFMMDTHNISLSVGEKKASTALNGIDSFRLYYSTLHSKIFYSLAYYQNIVWWAIIFHYKAGNELCYSSCFLPSNSDRGSMKTKYAYMSLISQNARFRSHQT